MSRKKQAIKKFEQEVESYREVSRVVELMAIELHELRRASAASTIKACEQYLSELANAPRKLNQSVGELKTEFASFEESVIELKAKAEEIVIKSSGGAIGGVATGVGVAALAPSAALAIATTFGTASTGTAIATLSGAAATNAALAWLGGGALIAGGGGMATGSALLALAGPVGWAIGGVSLIGSGGYAWRKNSKIIAEAVEKEVQIFAQRRLLERANREITQVIAQTQRHREGVEKQLNYCRAVAPRDYGVFSADDKAHLGALINNVQSLAQLLNQSIDMELSGGVT